MRSHVDNGGGIISSCDSDLLQFNRDTYSYVWPRDGAIIAMAFDMAGFPEVARMFFRFCDKNINQAVTSITNTRLMVLLEAAGTH